MIDVLLWVFAIIGVMAVIVGFAALGFMLRYLWRLWQFQKRMAYLVGAALAKKACENQAEPESNTELVN